GLRPADRAPRAGQGGHALQREAAEERRLRVLPGMAHGFRHEKTGPGRSAVALPGHQVFPQARRCQCRRRGRHRTGGTMKVIAAPGVKVPTEQKPREYITEDQAVDVEESAYYLRRLADGDLLPAPTDKTKGSK